MEPQHRLTAAPHTAEIIGIKVENGGNCTSVEAIDPSIFPDTKHMPRNMMYGLIHTHIKVDTAGGTAVVTFHLPTPAPRGHRWYVYSSSDGGS